MPPPGIHLANRERTHIPTLTPGDERQMVDATTVNERVAYVALGLAMPYQEERWWHRLGLTSTLKTSPEAYYQDGDEQPYSRSTALWAQRVVGERVEIELVTQERDRVTVGKRGKERMLPAEGERVRAVTTTDGRLKFPNDGENLFSVRQRHQVSKDILDGIELVSPKAVKLARKIVEAESQDD
jgi:hypothetical protein